VLDDRFEPFAHDLLKGHPLLDHGPAPMSVQQGLLDASKAAAQDTDDEVVLVVALRLGRANPVVVLKERDHPLGELGEDLSVGLPVGILVRVRRRHRRCLRPRL
jgi:hypothetical protein